MNGQALGSGRSLIRDAQPRPRTRAGVRSRVTRQREIAAGLPRCRFRPRRQVKKSSACIEMARAAAEGCPVSGRYRRRHVPVSAETDRPHGQRSTRQTDRVDIRVAGAGDVQDLALMLWVNASPDEQENQPVGSFAVDLLAWLADHTESHVAFVARVGTGAVGMSWVALVPRAPRPGVLGRWSADIQSVFVLPEQRGKGIGSRLVLAAVEHASQRGASRITVHSGREAVPVYERLGFASSRQLLQTPAEQIASSQPGRSADTSSA